MLENMSLFFLFNKWLKSYQKILELRSFSRRALLRAGYKAKSGIILPPPRGYASIGRLVSPVEPRYRGIFGHCGIYWNEFGRYVQARRHFWAQPIPAVGG